MKVIRHAALILIIYHISFYVYIIVEYTAERLTCMKKKIKKKLKVDRCCSAEKQLRLIGSDNLYSSLSEMKFCNQTAPSDYTSNVLSMIIEDTRFHERNDHPMTIVSVLPTLHDANTLTF